MSAAGAWLVDLEASRSSQDLWEQILQQTPYWNQLQVILDCGHAMNFNTHPARTGAWTFTPNTGTCSLSRQH
jgi:hypothetical protein